MEKNKQVIVIAAIVLAVILIGLVLCVRVIKPTEIAIKYNPITNSKKVITSGIRLIFPWETTKKWPTTIQTFTYKDAAQSRDGIYLEYDMVMTYRFDASKVLELYDKFADRDKKGIENIFLPSILTRALNTIAATYGHEQILGNETTSNSLPAVQQELYLDLKEMLIAYNIDVVMVTIKDAEADEQIEIAINNRGAAKQNAEAAKYLKQKAEEEAKALVITAQGQADANAILAKTTDRALELKRVEIDRIYAEKWNGVLPSVVTSSGGSIFDVSKFTK